jgi:hypothetical protein
MGVLKEVVDGMSLAFPAALFELLLPNRLRIYMVVPPI